METAVVINLVGNLPAYRALGEDDLICGLTCNGVSHRWECALDIMAFSPHGNLFHCVAVGDGSFFETVSYCNWSETVDASDLSMSIAEAWSVPTSSRCDCIATDVDTVLDRLLKEKIFDKGIQLFS